MEYFEKGTPSSPKILIKPFKLSPNCVNPPPPSYSRYQIPHPRYSLPKIYRLHKIPNKQHPRPHR